MLQTFLKNHVFANLTFALVLVVGFMAYFLLPRQKDPNMNFNWIQIITPFPGASAEDVEKLVTDPLEEALEQIPDVRFAASSSREGGSTILLRFNDIDDLTFNKRVEDLRREIKNRERELPKAAEDPQVTEITSANGYPLAIVIIKGQDDNENLRRQARHIQKDILRIKGIDKALAIGLRDPELHIRFNPKTLANLNIPPSHLADTITSRFRDISAGKIEINNKTWLLRHTGSHQAIENLRHWPIMHLAENIPIKNVATITRAREKATYLVKMDGKPCVMLFITKRPNINSLDLVKKIQNDVDQRQKMKTHTGVEVILADDTTPTVRSALRVMEHNALLGLFLVFLTTWFFLGGRVAILIGLGIPFTLAGTFGIIHSLDGSLNVMVLLGIVIALGMLVDDAVVVVESIYLYIQRGLEPLDAGLEALKEVFSPVTASVLTTIAAFLPLMLLPGILGKFMRIIPLVVSLALLLSLVEAFWMLPSHMAAMRFPKKQRLRSHWRTRFLNAIRIRYTKTLLFVLRRPRTFLFLALIPFTVAVSAITKGMVKVDFFAHDPLPVFYINVKMPPSSDLNETIRVTEQIALKAEKKLQPKEARAVVSYAGYMITETELYYGERYGQILVSIDVNNPHRRDTKKIINAMRHEITTIAGPESVTFLELSGGPPTTKPISIKIRGESYPQILKATHALKDYLYTLKPITDIEDDYLPGPKTLSLKLNNDPLHHTGISAREVIRTMQLLADGEVKAHFQHQGEKVEVRILADIDPNQDLEGFLRTPIALSNGTTIPLRHLVESQVQRGMDTIRHHNFRRTVTLSANLDKKLLDTKSANDKIKVHWQKIQHQYPGVSLDFSGILDDINESMDAIAVLFLFGIGLMYMILGTQFKSYWQPFMILTTVPMAFTGVVFGLLITKHPLSLYTLYGVVALSGIAVNACIVLISAANSRKNRGMRTLTAIIYAARRRVVPIFITTLTTMAGLFSLATGLAGHSLLWGPVATAIVWGLGFSTLLTLFLVPLLYWTFMGRKERKQINSLKERLTA
ncbi:efflux RND transporter permease subunit [Magnetococcales bacterium HHB-1]